MTLCDSCRRPMTIQQAVVDFGEGAEPFDFEACVPCRTVFVSGPDWTVVPG